MLQTFDKEGTGLEQCVKLMQLAKEKGDWDLCKELARFLMAIDETGNELRKAVEKMGITLTIPSPSRIPVSTHVNSQNEKEAVDGGFQSKTPRPNSNGVPKEYAAESANDYDRVSPKSSAGDVVGLGIESGGGEVEDRKADYFSHKRGTQS